MLLNQQTNGLPDKLTNWPTGQLLDRYGPMDPSSGPVTLTRRLPFACVGNNLCGRLHVGVERFLNAKIVTNKSDFEKEVSKDNFYEYSVIGPSVCVIVTDGISTICKNPIYVPAGVYESESSSLLLLLLLLLLLCGSGRKEFERML